MLLRAGIAVAAALVTLTGTAAADPGDVSTQVVGGSRASTKDFPFTVFLAKTGKKSSFCGGSIIAPNKILTAAHCVDEGETGPKPVPPSSIQVVAGRDDKDTGDGVVAGVTKIVLHPKWDGWFFDAAVLTLDRRLPQKPISLAGPLDSGLYQPGKKATVLGWGDTTEGGSSSRFLLKARIPILPDNDCRKFWGKFEDGVDVYQTKSMTCAAVMAGGIDACQGDSGGPFVENGKLIGLVKAGQGCARPNAPAIYTRTNAINNWVNQEIHR
ncbi:serine protease [Lentzea sp. NBRC 105346]|uniref:S1 family peptidase n=1 Tax=Lentzea sp. NBRC 105346 TaxID=3032205 RepID=UPI0024A09B8C|nr:serine protease [Lentzea sp. NBRC 105346]GLZ29975.1 serine protease [Lentzea sp. NBRC 105346]